MNINQEENCNLGAIDENGIPKILGKKFMFLEDILNELVCVISNFKPCCTYFPEKFVYNGQNSENDYLDLLLLVKRKKAKIIPYHENKTYDFNKNSYVNKNEYNTYLLWSNPKFEKSTLLLSLIWNNNLPNNLVDLLDKEYFKITDNLKFNLIINEPGDYINGFLLGYRKKEIRGYYLRNYLNSIFKKNNIKITNDEEWVLEIKKLKYKLETEDKLKNFDSEFKKLKKVCKNWIYYMMFDSLVFEQYMEWSKDKISDLILPNIIIKTEIKFFEEKFNIK